MDVQQHFSPNLIVPLLIDQSLSAENKNEGITPDKASQAAYQKRARGRGQRLRDQAYSVDLWPSDNVWRSH